MEKVAYRGFFVDSPIDFPDFRFTVHSDQVGEAGQDLLIGHCLDFAITQVVYYTDFESSMSQMLEKLAASVLAYIFHHYEQGTLDRLYNNSRLSEVDEPWSEYLRLEQKAKVESLSRSLGEYFKREEISEDSVEVEMMGQMPGTLRKKPLLKLPRKAV